MSVRSCPAVLIGAPSSGCGKTAFTAGLARRLWRQGKRVRVFKTGPDFLDPTLLAQASGAPVYQLDLWMMGEAHCRRLLFDAAGEADVILVEGVMGLHDGKPSSADLALLFGLPVLGLIDARAMAQTFGAVALGLAHYRPELNFFGVVANQVAGDSHAALLRESLPADISWCGALKRSPELGLPERHLGLLPADEVDDLESRLDGLADALGDLDGAFPLVHFRPAPPEAPPRRLQGLRIAVARDRAFSFLYQANLDLLETMGAALQFFSPLADESLPEGADSVFLPGGYPELHGQQLAANAAMAKALALHHRRGGPIYAECGGMMALFEQIEDRAGHARPAFGLLPGRSIMADRPVGLGMQAVSLAEGTLRGHSFHYSRVETALAPTAWSVPQRAGRKGEVVYRQGRLLASYLHLYFPSNPDAAARLFLP